MWRMPGTLLEMRSTSSRVKRTLTPALSPPAGKCADQVGAPLGKDGLDGAAESRAVSQQQHDGGDAPCHADHGDGGAAPVVEHCLPGLGENVFEHGCSSSQFSVLSCQFSVKLTLGDIPATRRSFFQPLVTNFLLD